MAIIDLIHHRHSIRHYLDRPVERQKIMQCLEAARRAPSASNSQPWHFIVVDEPNLKNKLCDAAFGGLFSVMEFPRQAPVLVAAVVNPPGPGIRMGNLVLRTNFSLIDMGIAVEHFILQADELGLGTCWMGLFDEKKVKKTLGIPRDRKVVALLPLGYFDEALAQRGHSRKALGEMSSFNGWNIRE